MLFGPGEKAAATVQDPAIMVDDAIVAVDPALVEDGKDEAIVDDAIVFEDDAIVKDEKTPEKKDLTQDDIAILKAAKQKPLWQEEGDRKIYTQAQLLKAFTKSDEIDFSLFDADYLSVFEVFSSQPTLPFNRQPASLEQVNVSKFQEKPRDKRYQQNKGAAKQPWKQAQEEEPEEDPEWIEFDPQKERTKFLGHTMEDESKIREQVLRKKESRQNRAETGRKKAAEQAKMEKMTEEQLSILDAADQSTIDPAKLKEAEALAAQIEAESFSRYDVDYERQRKARPDDALNDDQLQDLFAEMKRETQAKKQKEMPKFVSTMPADDDGELLGGLEDDEEEELEAPRGLEGLLDDAIIEDSPPRASRIGYVQVLSPVPKPDAEAPKLFNEEFKAELGAYRERRKQEMAMTQEKTAESNLEALFSNFKVVTQQRHKVDLEVVKNFEEPADGGVSDSLIPSIFAQVNPFAPYVIQDIMEEGKESEPADDDRIWNLHESLFKKGPDHEVNPDNLRKTSAQMFSVYKYYENPQLRVKAQVYTGNEDYVEVKELVPKVRFFDAPDLPIPPTVEA